MKANQQRTNQQKIPFGPLAKQPQPIIRSPAEGPDYQPGWRARLVGQYMTEIAREDDQLAKTKELWEAAPDDFVRRLIEFHCGVMSNDKPAIDYALRIPRDEQTARLIEAMIVADYSAQQIAEELGTDPIKIEFFEKFYFDIRPYLENRGWLQVFCCRKGQHRWLRIAFARGQPGVEEIVLCRKKKRSRDLKACFSVLLGRAQDHLLDLEADNVALDEMDLERFLRLSQISALDQLPCLEDSEEEKPLTLQEKASLEIMRRLPAASRERVAFFVEQSHKDAEHLAIESLNRRYHESEIATQQKQAKQNGEEPDCTERRGRTTGAADSVKFSDPKEATP